MSDRDLLNSIDALTMAATTLGLNVRPFLQLSEEVNRLITRREHYKSLYLAMCAKYGAEECYEQTEV